jgi:enamine deaminase RidA (YjgF/YER057c/UK114 family)
MSKQIISTADAPAAIGTYSQAVPGRQYHLGVGPDPLDPKTKELVKGDIEAQVRQVFDNLKAIVVAAARASMTWSRPTCF